MAHDSPHVLLDVRGSICPYPLIEIKLALRRVPEGGVLEVLSDSEPAATATVPAFCERAGHRVEVTEAGRQAWRIVIRPSVGPR